MRKVPTDRPIKEYREKFDIDCWEVSAKTGYNVKEVFNELLESNCHLMKEFIRKILRLSPVPFMMAVIGGRLLIPVPLLCLIDKL